MLPYKFAPHSQKKDSHLVGTAFGSPLRRSNLDTDTNTTESTNNGIFDTSFSQSFSSRHVESYSHGGSPYQHHIPETTAIKASVSATQTSSRLSTEPTDICLKPRGFFSSSRDDSKRMVKTNTQELDQSASTNEVGLDVFSAAMVKHRNLESKCDQQRDYITELESRLAAKNEENATLSRSVARTEAANKHAVSQYQEALGRVTKNYSALKSEFDDFKLASQSLSLTISEVRAALEGINSLRDSTRTRLRDIESIFDDEGQFILTAEIRDTVHELRSELSKTQQVADMLREKLHTMGTELAEARARNLELEGMVTTDRNKSESTALKICQSADQLTELARYLQEQKHESVQAAAQAYEMEQQLANTRTRLQEAQAMMTSMREEMAEREKLNEEQDVKLRTLRHAIDFQDGNVKTLEARARKAEEELVKALNHNHELQGWLDSAKGLEKNLTQQASRLLAERDEVKENLQLTERQLAEVHSCEKSLSADLAKASVERNALIDKLKTLEELKCELEMYHGKYNGSQVSLKVLQERFDDQCVAFAAAKESIGDLQERLHAAERQATEMSMESRREMIHLEEQNRVLKAGLDRTEKEIGDKNATLQALRNELSHKEGALQALLEAERLGKKEAVDQVHEAKTQVESLRTELTQKDHRMQEMARRLAAVEAPLAEREREVEALKSHIAELETTKKKLVDRAATISHRYENNDLNDDEKALVALLMRKARAIHDREMVEKTNEIKLRDSVLKENKARIVQLEGLLAQWAKKDLESSTKSTDERSNPIAVDGTRPQVPPPDYQPEIRGVGRDDHPTAVTRGAPDEASENLAVAGPTSRSTNYSTFSKLCREDTDDIASFEDEIPPVATGKRVMFAEVESESTRPARRVKHSKGTGVEKEVVDQAVVPASGSGVGGKKKAAPRRR